MSDRRLAIAAGRKVSGDLRDAFESVAGEASPLTTFSALLRRLERRTGQAPELIEPCLKALDGVLVALDHAQATVEDALQRPNTIRRELEMVEERLFALRAAARKHGVAPDALPDLLERFTQDIAALEAGRVAARPPGQCRRRGTRSLPNTSPGTCPTRGAAPRPSSTGRSQ